jgi:acyl-CoA reductase-like NAD-dependent aldehyde dehydrogenase
MANQRQETTARLSRPRRSRLANDSEHGLVADVFSRDYNRVNRPVRAVEDHINEWFAGGVETPFGGTRASGIGREKGLLITTPKRRA